MARRYAPIWDKLKKDGFVVLAVPRALHPRLIRSVRDQKYRDVAYKISLDDQEKEAWIFSKSEGSKLSFTLQIKTRPVLSNL